MAGQALEGTGPKRISLYFLYDGVDGLRMGEKVPDLLATWRMCQRLPAGKWLFSRLLGRRAPYSGSISPLITALRPGYARVELRDRRAVRNHLDSIHAIALANLGEIASGLALLCSLPAHVRGIVTHISIDYLKKARGRLVAESRVTLPEVNGDLQHRVRADIRDQSGEVVARIEVSWQLGLKTLGTSD